MQKNKKILKNINLVKNLKNINLTRIEVDGEGIKLNTTTHTTGTMHKMKDLFVETDECSALNYKYNW